jgi:transposase-like protein
MRRAKENPKRQCPHCEKKENQINAGRNRSGTQRCYCNDCKKYYTLEPKQKAYDEEIRSKAMKIYYSGVSGRGVGKLLGMNKANVYNWIKKRSEC